MFPTIHKQASEGDLTVVTISFADKFSIMVYKKGKIGKIYNVPLSSAVTGYSFNTSNNENENDEDESLFPLPHLTPQALLGAGNSDDIQGQLYSTQIASIVSRQSPDENRTVVVGLASDIGPKENSQITQDHKKELLTIIKLVQECRVW